MASKQQTRRVPRPTAKSRKAAPAKRSRATEPNAPSTKIDDIVAALRAREGATLSQLMALTGWQAHSVRGAISGALKKARGLAITSKRVGDERTYRIENGR